MIRTLAAAFLLAFAAQIGAAELRPFDATSLPAIRVAEAGKPFVLAFWSTTCEPCRDDMKVLKAAQRRFPGVTVHLVSVDPPAQHATVEAFLRRATRWAFADNFSERVRYAVDPAWRGELPRTYLFDRGHRVETVTGTLSYRELSRWLERQVR